MLISLNIGRLFRAIIGIVSLHNFISFFKGMYQHFIYMVILEFRVVGDVNSGGPMYMLFDFFPKF